MWQPIETAPKDGTVIELTWMDDEKPQEIFPMQWEALATNRLFDGAVGFWITPDKSVTWNHRDQDGAPTHWRHCAYSIN